MNLYLKNQQKRVFLIDYFKVKVKRMKQILSSKELDAQLNEKGFVVVPFLHKDEVQELRTFFEDNHRQDIPSFYATAHALNVDFRKKMNEKIREVFERSINNYFQNCKPLGGSFIVKSNKGSQILNAHQDWNIVSRIFKSTLEYVGNTRNESRRSLDL